MIRNMLSILGFLSLILIGAFCLAYALAELIGVTPTFIAALVAFVVGVVIIVRKAR